MHHKIGSAKICRTIVAALLLASGVLQQVSAQSPFPYQSQFQTKIQHLFLSRPQVQYHPPAKQHIISPSQQSWKDLPPKQFNRIRETNTRAVLIDTRMEAKYERERIPGARPAPYSEELRALTDTLGPQTPLLIYCGADERSTTVCEMLTEEMGFRNVFRLKGGLRRWKKENLPVDTSPKAGS